MSSEARIVGLIVASPRALCLPSVSLLLDPLCWDRVAPCQNGMCLQPDVGRTFFGAEAHLPVVPLSFPLVSPVA